MDLERSIYYMLSNLFNLVSNWLKHHSPHFFLVPFLPSWFKNQSYCRKP